MFQGVFPKVVFGFIHALQRCSTEPKRLFGAYDHRVICEQFRNTNGFVSTVWWDTVFRHSNNFLMGMENVLLEALFSPLGIKNVFQDTKKFNVDSPMGTKKCLLSFKCLSKHKQLPNYFDLQSCQNNIFSIWELCLILLINSGNTSTHSDKITDDEIY